MTETEIAAKAHVNAVIFSRLRNNRRYFPAEQTVWALIFALELNFEEANSLMNRAKMYLSENVWSEVLIGFFIENQIYNVKLLNKVLTHYGFAPLEVTEDFSTAAKKFRDEDLIARIDLYIEENFFDTSRLEEQSKRGVKVFYTASHLGEPAEPPKTFEVIVRKLKDKLGMKGNLFSDYLFKLMKQKKMTESDICTRAHFGIINFYNLRLEKNYRPSKEIILAIAFVLKLNFKETNTLLERAGYFLANTYKEDVIAAYFFDNQIYDLSLINEVLDYYDCPILGD